MYIKRTASKVVQDLAGKFRIVSVVGPRQSGKTTLLQHAFPDKPYVSLEDLRVREFAQSDPVGFLKQYQDGAFLDEVHHVPNLLSQIQTIVDQKNEPGQFILSGSNNLLVSEEMSQSLAGRVFPLTLLPLSIEELSQEQLVDKEYSLDVILKGGYPEVWQKSISPTLSSSAYIATYVERDVRQLVNVGDLSLFRRFIELLASNTGQLLNKESFSNALGIRGDTVERWLSVLEATYVVFRLRPWHRNVKKRLVKTPKVYFYDTGLACYLLGIEAESLLKKHPLHGALFENMLVVEYIKWAHHRAREPRATFFRDSRGNEVDLTVQLQTETTPIEIKSSQTFNESFLKGVKVLQSIEANRAKPIIALGASDSQRRTDFDASSWWQLSEFLSERLE